MKTKIYTIVMLTAFAVLVVINMFFITSGKLSFFLGELAGLLLILTPARALFSIRKKISLGRFMWISYIVAILVFVLMITLITIDNLGAAINIDFIYTKWCKNIVLTIMCLPFLGIIEWLSK